MTCSRLIDTNGNGAISQNELSSYLTSLQQQMQTDQGTLMAFASLSAKSTFYTAGGNLFAANTRPEYFGLILRTPQNAGRSGRCRGA